MGLGRMRHLENTPQSACRAAGTGSLEGGGGDRDTERGCDCEGACLAGESGNIGLMWSRKHCPLLALLTPWERRPSKDLAAGTC